MSSLTIAIVLTALSFLCLLPWSARAAEKQRWSYVLKRDAISKVELTERTECRGHSLDSMVCTGFKLTYKPDHVQVETNEK